MMLVDILLLVISIILMIREFFPKIEEYYSKRKRIVHIVLIGGMFILSLINIVNTNIENQNLIDTATKTLEKIDGVYINQAKTDSTLQQSVGEIKKVDSVLGNIKDTIQYQVKLLDTAIGKSEELVRLEALDFESKKAEFDVTNIRILPLKKDTTTYRIRAVLVNKGRKGLLVYSEYVLFFLDKEGRVEFLPKKFNSDDSLVSFELSTQSSNNVSIGYISKKSLEQNLTALILVSNIIYKDMITNKIYKKPEYYRMVLPFKEGDRFQRLSPHEIQVMDGVLKLNKRV